MTRSWPLDQLGMALGLALALLSLIIFAMGSPRAAASGDSTAGTAPPERAESSVTGDAESGDPVRHAMAASYKHGSDDHVLPAGVLTYTIHISRAHEPHSHGAGHGKERHVTLTDTLPYSGHARFLGWGQHPTGTTVSPDGHIHWDGQMEPGESRTIQYRIGVEGILTPATVLTNHAQLGWHGGGMHLGPVTTAITLPHGMLALGPHEGGQLHHRYGVTATVPRDAVSDTTRFEATPLFADAGPWGAGQEAGLMFAGRVFELKAVRFGRRIERAMRPLTVTLDLASDLDLKPSSLQVRRRDGLEKPWSLSIEPLTATAEAVIFTTTHLGQFAVFGEPASRLYLPLVMGG